MHVMGKLMICNSSSWQTKIKGTRRNHTRNNLSLHPCMAGVLEPWLGKWRNEEKTDILTHRKAEIWWPELSDGEAAALWELTVFTVYICTGRRGYCIQAGKEAGLLHTTEQGGRIIVYSSTVRLGYCIQLSKFIESQQRSLCSERRHAMVDISCTTINIHTQKGEILDVMLTPTQGELCHANLPLPDQQEYSLRTLPNLCHLQSHYIKGICSKVSGSGWSASCQSKSIL